jgi:hypothetical protein
MIDCIVVRSLLVCTLAIVPGDYKVVTPKTELRALMPEIHRTYSSHSIPTWHRLCYEAAQEADAVAAIIKIGLACEAIDERLTQTTFCSFGNPQEVDDLRNASVYLRLLLLTTRLSL